MGNNCTKGTVGTAQRLTSQGGKSLSCMVQKLFNLINANSSVASNIVDFRLNAGIRSIRNIISIAQKKYTLETSVILILHHFFTLEYTNLEPRIKNMINCIESLDSKQWIVLPF